MLQLQTTSLTAVLVGNGVRSFRYKVGDQIISLSAKQQAVLSHIGYLLMERKVFPGPHDVISMTGKALRDYERGVINTLFRTLEKKGLISRKSTGDAWKKTGSLTIIGIAILEKLEYPPPPLLTQKKEYRGGISDDGGTRFKDKLFSVDSGTTIVRPASPYSKLGPRVTKGSSRSRQKGLKIATFSLEEGRTCDPQCGLAKICYAGNMPRQQRILYEGEKTDRAVADAIYNHGPAHYRINTIGDIPTQGFLERILEAVIASRSTAFGYTHWQPENKLGGQIRLLSDQSWDFFSIRTSYEHGSRKPLKKCGAVTMEKFDKELLAEHNAIPCPEQLGQVKNCGECGLCWTTCRNITFQLH